MALVPLTLPDGTVIEIEGSAFTPGQLDAMGGGMTPNPMAGTGGAGPGAAPMGGTAPTAPPPMGGAGGAPPMSPPPMGGAPPIPLPPMGGAPPTRPVGGGPGAPTGMPVHPDRALVDDVFNASLNPPPTSAAAPPKPVQRPLRGVGAATPSAPAPWLVQEMQNRGEYDAPEKPLTVIQQAEADKEREFNSQMEAAYKLQEERKKATQIEQAALEEENKRRATEVQAAEQLRAEIETQTNQLTQRSQEEVDRAGALEVDTDRYWKDRGNLARVLGAVGIAIGEVARVWGAPSNAAADIINTAIERDIAEQQMEIEQGWARAKAADNALVRYSQVYGSVPAAREHVRAAMYAQAEGEYKAALLAKGMAEEEANTHADVAMLSAKRAEAQAEERRLIAMNQELLAQKRAADARNAKAKPPDLGEVINYRGEPRGNVKNPASAKAIQDRLNAAQALKSHVRHLRKLNEKWRVPGLNPQNRSEFEVAAQDAGMAYKEMRQLGAMDAGTQKLLDEIMPGVNQFGYINESRMKAVDKAIDREVDVILQNSVVDPKTGRGVSQPTDDVPGAEPVQ